VHAAEKTTAILVLTEALEAATLIKDPAPLVERLRDWMDASPRTGDLVVETSTAHRGLNLRRVGVVLKISRHRSPYDRVTEILLLDPPCGNMSCKDLSCIHRLRWSNATFVRVPSTAKQLTEALGRTHSKHGVGRDDLVTVLVDAGFEVRPAVLDVAVCQDCRECPCSCQKHEEHYLLNAKESQS
jgi:hypothetical protein